MADETSDASGIFTTQDEDAYSSSFARPRRGGEDDDASTDIVAEFPSLDDDNSVIISEEDISGVYTKSQQSQSSTGGRMGAAPSVDAANMPYYDIENSTSDGDTNMIMGNYSKVPPPEPSTPPPDEKKSSSWFSDALQMFGVPIATMPTSGSSPDRASVEKTSPVAEREPDHVKPEDMPSYGVPKKVVNTPPPVPVAGEQPAKVCGMKASRMILISSCLVIIALVVVIAAIVISGDDDDGDGGSRGIPSPGENSPDIEDFVTTTVPTMTPTMTPTAAKPDDPSECPPDIDNVSFLVASETGNCTWLRNREPVFVEFLCESEQEVADLCLTTCKSCNTNITTLAPTAAPSTATPTTSSPTIFLITQFPTAPTDPPTQVPTGSPTAAPTFGPTTNPTSIPTFVPTFLPTFEPTGFPTFEPSPEPTFQITNGPTSPSVSAFPSIVITEEPTATLTLGPTSAPSVEANCEPDLPGPIPDFAGGQQSCAWLSQTNVNYRRNQCEPGDPAFLHCPTTCRSCIQE